MKLELNLIENSIDYLLNSLELFHIANEFGNYDKERINIQNKMKWKFAFISMVQAYELLLKQSLYNIQQNLIYENIDDRNIGSDSKTISFKNGIIRLNNFSDINYKEKEILFLNKCSNIRNEFIHYKVFIRPEQLKSNYCQLYYMYNELYKKFYKNVNITEKFPIDSSIHYNYISDEILEFYKSNAIFRGVVLNEESIKELKNEIEENKKMKYILSNDLQKVERIRYGYENDLLIKNTNLTEEFLNNSAYSFNICHDCLAKKNEYHLDNCDMEVCPICSKQLITCGCMKEILE